MKKESKKIKGFTLIEMLVVVLIIGILAGIALPQYQLATDKAKYAQMMDFTKAISDSQMRALILTETPTFNDLDIDIPANCILSYDKLRITCDNGTWGCILNNVYYQNYIFSYCSNIKLKATYYYQIKRPVGIIRRCYAHTTNSEDRANRLCQAVTEKKYSEVEPVTIFDGSRMDMRRYLF